MEKASCHSVAETTSTILLHGQM